MESAGGSMLDILLEEFHPSTMWNGGILILIAFVIIGYFLLLPTSKKHPVWKSILFVAGLVAVYASLGSPLNVIGRMKFSIHIIQIVLLFFIAPPLIILGFKNEILRTLNRIEVFRDMINFLTKPIVAIIIFYLLFYIYHIPAVFNSARLGLALNYVILFIILIAAIFLWVPLLKPDVLTNKQKWIYSIMNMVLIVPYVVILLMANEGIYALYTDFDLFMSSLVICLPSDAAQMTPEFFQALLPFDPANEQKIGAVILLISQIIIFTIGAIKGRKLNQS